MGYTKTLMRYSGAHDETGWIVREGMHSEK